MLVVVAGSELSEKDVVVVIYLSGAMRGIPRYNFPAFDRVAYVLRMEGHTVLSPADIDRQFGFDAMNLPVDHNCDGIPEGFDFKACVRRDIEAVLSCDKVVMLPGWEHSKGAKSEKALAEWIGVIVEEWNRE